MSTAAASSAFCAYCGLPTANMGSAPRFCCYGCRFAASVSNADGGSDEAQWMFTRLGIAIFCTMNVLAFTMALWSGDVYGPAGAATSASGRTLEAMFRLLCLFFSLPVLYVLGLPLAENAFASAKQWIINTDLLLVIGVAAAFLVSIYAVVRDDGPIYFEVACVILVLVTLGRWLEATARARATQGLESLEKLLPSTAHVIVNERELEKLLDQVAIGDVVRVRAGERIPCDGRLLCRAAMIDEQLLTGESRPRPKEPGDALFAGTMNLDADLQLSVEHPPATCVLARIAELLTQARQSKGLHERLADRLAAWFLPMVVLIALTAAAWHGVSTGPAAGIMAALAVVLIACPCALGIATPLALWSAFTQAARHGVLLRHGEALERLAFVRHFCFDKTGTLTTGSPTVIGRRIEAGEDGIEIDRRAGTLAAASNHVYSKALAAAAACEPRADVVVETVAGRGVRAQWPGESSFVCLGSERWMRELGMTISEALESFISLQQKAGAAIVILGWSGRVRAAFALAEEPRPESREVVEQLKLAGSVAILTGDQPESAARWQHWLDVDVHAGLLPEQKLQILEAKCSGGRRVAMIGDGINDGPALAASDVGIALGCGADITRDHADICLLDDDLRKIPWLVHLSRFTVRVIRQNLFWAFAYNGVGVGLACLGLLNPVIAAAAMVLSSLFVLVNSLRIQRMTFADREAAA